MNARQPAFLLVSMLLAGTVDAQVKQRPSDPEPQQPPAFVLSPGRAGVFEVGATVDEIYKLVGRERVSLVDRFREGHFTPAIEIRVPGTSVAPSVVAPIREAPCREFAVWGLTVLDPRFRTPEGLGVGSTVIPDQRASRRRTPAPPPR